MSPASRRRLLPDPWIFDGAFDRDDPKRLDILEQLFREVRRDPCSVIESFLGQTYWDRFDDGESVGRNARRVLGRLRSALQLLEAMPSPAASVTPLPEDVSDEWKRALHHLTAPDETLAWRSATILMTRERSVAWPAPPNASVLGLASPTRRCVAILEEIDSHPDYRHDVNPWLYRGDADCRHQLPMPPELIVAEQGGALRIAPGFPMEAANGEDGWQQRLQLARANGWQRTAGGVVLAHYIPGEEWRPELVGRDEWQRRRVFPHACKNTKKGPMSGPVDYKGQVWSWDDRECHWDVQCADPRILDQYVRVSHNGRLL